MEISRRVFPYPVLSEFTNDYKSGFFRSEIDTENDGETLILRFKCSLENEMLSDMLRKKTVVIAHHIENPQTGYRRAVSVYDLDCQYFINKNDINGRLTISTFIVASDDVRNYTNNEFHEDYHGFMFDFDRGTIIAVADQYTINIEKNLLDILNRESIFSIVRNSDKSKSVIENDITNDKIIIKITEDDYSNLSNIKSIPSLQSTINSIFVIPVLVDVMHRIVNTSPEERDINYGMLAWYRVIRKALKTNFNIDIDEEHVENFRILSLSQKLVGSPISNTLSVLSDNYTSTNSEEM